MEIQIEQKQTNGTIDLNAYRLLALLHSQNKLRIQDPQCLEVFERRYRGRFMPELFDRLYDALARIKQVHKARALSNEGIYFN